MDTVHPVMAMPTGTTITIKTLTFGLDHRIIGSTFCLLVTPAQMIWGNLIVFQELVWTKLMLSLSAIKLFIFSHRRNMRIPDFMLFNPLSIYMVHALKNTYPARMHGMLWELGMFSTRQSMLTLLLQQLHFAH